MSKSAFRLAMFWWIIGCCVGLGIGVISTKSHAAISSQIESNQKCFESLEGFATEYAKTNVVKSRWRKYKRTYIASASPTGFVINVEFGFVAVKDYYPHISNYSFHVDHGVNRKCTITRAWQS